MQLALIAAGGAAGALLRYGLSEALRPAPGSFPLATLAANVSGAFLLGLLAALLAGRFEAVPQARLAITVGLLGAYTTFSTFSLETLDLLHGGEWRTAALYVAASVGGAIGAAWAGQTLARG